MTTRKKPTAPRTRKKPSADAIQNEQRLATLSHLLGRSRLMTRLAGVQYNGNRDIYTTAGYVAQDQVTFDHYWGIYKRGDIGGRIVDMPAKTTWRTPPQVVEMDGEEVKADTKFVQEFNKMAKRLRLWHYLMRVDMLAGIGRYAVLMLGVRNATAQAQVTPLVKVSKPEDVIYLGVYHEKNAAIKEWVTDTGDPRYGLPKVYQLKVSSSHQGFANADMMVHASRVIHVAENVLEDDVFGRPRLERPLNRLFDLDKVAASTGEAYWQAVARILQAKVDPEMEADDALMKDLDEKLSEMIHDLRRTFHAQGVDLSWLDSKTPDVSQVSDFYFSLIAGATGYPKRILFGSEMGELASSQDQENFYGQINERQEHFAEPTILRAFIDRMIAVTALPKPQTGEYKIVWPTLFEAPEKEKSEVMLNRARAAKELTPVGGNPLRLVNIEEDGNITLQPRQHDDELPEDMEGGGETDELVDGGDEMDDGGADDDLEAAPASGGRRRGGRGTRDEEE